MRLLLAAVLATLASGPASSAFEPFTKCTHVSRGFRACTTFYETNGEKTAIYRRSDGGWKTIVGGLPHRRGWWRRVVTAPDRKTLLAQWSGECEAQSTYFVSSAGSRVRSIFRGHNSTIAGWTHPGLARVRLDEAIWRKHTEVYGPGIYLVNPKTLSVTRQREKPARAGC